VSDAIQIVALGARTPVGLSAESCAAAVRAGISRVKLHPFLVDAWGGHLRCGLDGLLKATDLGGTRLLSLAYAAVREALKKLPALSAPLSCWLCLPAPRPGFGAAEALALAEALPRALAPFLNGHALSMRIVLEGHAGGVLALEQAAAELSAGKLALCLVAAVDCYLEADTLSWLERDRRVSQGPIRGGFPPGEGAAVVALCSVGAQKELGLPVLASIAALATARELAHEHSDEGLQGRALAEVYTRVGSALGAGERFDEVFIDINDERARSTDYAFALLRAATLFRDGAAYVTSVASTGELGAASAIFHCVLAARAFAVNYARGPHALVSAASWGGLRGAILLTGDGG
jgi:3-oxoacyl-[acyl-carrier-protein] synthase-1